jgi:hypothetical protein
VNGKKVRTNEMVKGKMRTMEGNKVQKSKKEKKVRKVRK